MKKSIGAIIKVLFVTTVVLWICIILVEYYRYQDNKPMLIVLKEETKTYDDGHVYVYWGLGYKSIIYERETIYGKEFGHIFTEIKDQVPNTSKE